MCELWCDRMNGVFQLNRNGCRPGRDRGAIRAEAPVFMFRRSMFPSWLSAYTTSGSFGSTWQTNPSPQETFTQSVLIGPGNLSDRLGPPQLPLSCNPPYTRYGVRVSTATW